MINISTLLHVTHITVKREFHTLCKALYNNKICSDPNSFDWKCNDLEKWSVERGYSFERFENKFLRQEFFQETPSWIGKMKNKIKGFFLIWRNIQNLQAELHLLLTPNVGCFYKRANNWPYTAWKVSRYGVFSGPYFLAFGLNTERYGVIQIRRDTDSGPEKTPYLDAFHAVRNGKSLKDHLVREAVLPSVNAEDWSKPSGG